MNDIKSINLTFENCEEMDIDFDDITAFEINNICRNISYACGKKFSYNTAEDIVITFRENASILKDLGKFARLMVKDITIVTLTFFDNSEESFYVPWGDNDSLNNILQQNTFINNQVTIKISR